MKITIITVTKNNKAGLLRAIECVRNQTYKNVEHIIVDGGSTDGTVEILQNFDKLSAGSAQNDTLRQAQGDKLPTTHYSLHTISEADTGIYDAINKGIKLATGDVIGLLHSDDIFANPEVLEKVAQVFDERNIDSVYSDLMYISKVKEENIKKNKGKVIRLWKSGEFKHSSLRFGWMPPHPTLFVKKSVFEKYGLYETSLKIAADYDMILRLFYKHKITTHYLPLTTYLMTIGGASNKSVKNILQKSKEDLQTIKSHNLPHPLITLISKNFRKLPQFMTRDLS